jgi:hypothetical protein
MAIARIRSPPEWTPNIIVAIPPMQQLEKPARQKKLSSQGDRPRLFFRTR